MERLAIVFLRWNVSTFDLSRQFVPYKNKTYSVFTLILGESICVSSVCQL